MVGQLHSASFISRDRTADKTRIGQALLCASATLKGANRKRTLVQRPDSASYPGTSEGKANLAGGTGVWCASLDMPYLGGASSTIDVALRGFGITSALDVYLGRCIIDLAKVLVR